MTSLLHIAHAQTVHQNRRRRPRWPLPPRRPPSRPFPPPRGRAGGRRSL